MRKGWGWTIVFAACAVLFGLMGLVVGSTPMGLAEALSAIWSNGASSNAVIVHEVRLPHVLTAVLVGAGLAVCGVLMQSVFRNPLAGPGVLGISSGASLGVAVVMLAAPLMAGLPIPRDLLAVCASVAGASVVLLLIVLADRRIGDAATLLIVGLMVGQLCAALTSVLQAGGEAAAVKGLVLWGMGSFAGVDIPRLPWLAVPIVFACAASFPLMKAMNALMLDDDGARSLGVDVARTRRSALWITGILAGTITAFCGPVGFIGLITPHIVRAAARTSDHRVLLPASVALGAALACGCDVLVRWAAAWMLLPLNAVTGMLGAPVVLWVLWRGKHRSPA